MKNIHWFIAATAILALSFLVKSPYVAFSLYAFLLLAIIANLSSRAWLSGLECERKIGATILQQGDEVCVEVTVRNTRGWPIPWIFVEDFAPADFPRTGLNAQLTMLMPGRSVTLNYALRCPRRGYHRIGPLLMESGDLFGLQRRFKTGEQQDYISVLPTIAYIGTFHLSTRRPQGPVRLSNRIYEDPSRISNIREYAPGDPLSRIHWKASARTGSLFVKQYQPSSVIGGTLILDLHDDSYVPEKKEERMELAITTAASIAYLLQMSGEQAGMITNAADAAEMAQYDVPSKETLVRFDAEESVPGERETTRLSPLCVPTRRSSAQAVQIAENLARVLPGHSLDASQLILNEFRRLPRDAALLPIVPQISEALALTLAEMKHSGFAVTVFLINDPAHYDEAAALLAAHAIHVIHIEHERQLHEISPARIGQ